MSTGQTHLTATAFDNEGRIKEIAYPWRRTDREPLILSNSYNANGYLTTVASTLHKWGQTR